VNPARELRLRLLCDGVEHRIAWQLDDESGVSSAPRDTGLVPQTSVSLNNDAGSWVLSLAASGPWPADVVAKVELDLPHATASRHAVWPMYWSPVTNLAWTRWAVVTHNAPIAISNGNFGDDTGIAEFDEATKALVTDLWQLRAPRRREKLLSVADRG
jgi:hypothetical protein